MTRRSYIYLKETLPGGGVSFCLALGFKGLGTEPFVLQTYYTFGGRFFNFLVRYHYLLFVPIYAIFVMAFLRFCCVFFTDFHVPFTITFVPFIIFVASFTFCVLCGILIYLFYFTFILHFFLVSIESSVLPPPPESVSFRYI